MTTPLISICLPNLNTRPFLDERMETILNQTMADWELIVCDSYSEDGAWEFFQKFKGDKRVRLYQVPREGLYAGWNECLRRATGEYIYIAASDDTAKPTVLEKLLIPLERHRELHLAVCDYQPIDMTGQPLYTHPHTATHALLGEWINIPSIRNGQTEFLFHACLETIWHAITSILFRRSLLEQTGLFRTDLGPQADNEWAMRASLKSNIAYIPERLTTYRRHAGQATQTAYSPYLARQMLFSIEAVLRDPQAGIPEKWKAIPHWEQLITSVWRNEYLDAYGLYRGVAKRHPARFVRNVVAAGRREPGFLFRQALRGFAWSDEFSPDKIRVAHKLVKLFNTPWPPAKISTW